MATGVDVLPAGGRSFYDVLQVSFNASEREITQNFRQLARRFHPDRTGSSDDHRMKELTSAYKTLLDPELRQRHDETLSGNLHHIDLLQSRLPGGKVFSELFREMIGIEKIKQEFSSKSRSSFLSQKAAIKQFSEAWKEFVNQLPGSKITPTFHDGSGETAPPMEYQNEINRVCDVLQMAVQAGNLEAIADVLRLNGAKEWRDIMVAFHKRTPKLNVPARYQPVLRLVNALAQRQVAGNTRDILMTHIQLSQAVWEGLKDFYDTENVDASDLLSLALAASINEIEKGVGHPTSLVKDYSIADDELTALMFPSSNPHAPQLMWATVAVDVINGLREEHWMGWQVPGTDMHALYWYEKTVAENVLEKSEFNAETAGNLMLDLIPSCKSIAQLLCGFLAAAKWFIRHAQTCPNLEEKFVAKRLVREIIAASREVLTQSTCPVYLRIYAYGYCFALLRRIVVDSDVAETSDVDAALDDLKNFYTFSTMVPFPFLPTLSIAEGELFRQFSDEIGGRFLLDLQSLPGASLPFPERIFHYQIFENNLLGVYSLTNPAGAREKCAQFFLQEKSWDWAEAEAFMMSPLFGYDGDGWLVEKSRLGGRVERDKIKRIRGFEINLKSLEVNLKIDFAGTVGEVIASWFNKPISKSLLSFEDLANVFRFDEPSLFSLDPLLDPEWRISFHPLQNAYFTPKTLERSEFLHTLFICDYIMKQMSLGQEICYEAPFRTRPLSEGNFWTGIPETLRHALRPLGERGHRRCSAHRFWIQADEIKIRKSQSNDTFRMQIDEVVLSVRSMPMIPDETGRLKDLEVRVEDAAQSFADDFTRCYDEFSEYVPVFRRLKELVKLQHCGIHISSIKEQLSGVVTEATVRLSEMYAKELSEKERKLVNLLESLQSDMQRQLPCYSGDVDACNAIAQQMAKSFKSLKLDVTKQEAYDWIRNWTSSQEFAEMLACRVLGSLESIRQRTIEPIEMALKGLRDLTTKVIPTNQRECTWVPAVFKNTKTTEGLQVVYGGVVLCPKTVTSCGSVSMGTASNVQLNGNFVNRYSQNVGIPVTIYQSNTFNAPAQSSKEFRTNASVGGNGGSSGSSSGGEGSSGSGSNSGGGGGGNSGSSRGSGSGGGGKAGKNGIDGGGPRYPPPFRNEQGNLVPVSQRIKADGSNFKNNYVVGRKQGPGPKPGPGEKERPMRHFVQCSSRKDAEDRARSAGKGCKPIHDRKDDKKGHPAHFHPANKSGNKRADGSHYIYPEK